MATINLGQVRDKITSITRTNGSGAPGTDDTYTIKTECSPNGAGTFSVHNGSDIFVHVSNAQYSAVEEVLDDIADEMSNAGQTDTINKYYWGYAEQDNVYIVVYGGSYIHSSSSKAMSGYMFTGVGAQTYSMNMYNNRRFRAKLDVYNDWEITYEDVDWYLNKTTNEYDYSDSDFQDLLTEAESDFEYAQNHGNNQAKRQIFVAELKNGGVYEGRNVFVLGSNRAGASNICLWGFDNTKGYFMAYAQTDNSDWLISWNGLTHLGPYTSTADLARDIDTLTRAGLLYGASYSIVSITAYKQITSMEGGVTHMAMANKQCRYYFEHSEDPTVPPVIKVWVTNYSGTQTEYLYSNDGYLHVVLDATMN